MASKIPKNHFEIKNQIELVYVFSHEFKSKKTLNINSSHQIKLFDTNIDQLDSTNRCQ